jgi:hypothetical protein
MSMSGTTLTFNDATTQTTTGIEFPSTTAMLFQQTSAPTGWTKSTSHNDKVLRVVSGSVVNGGVVPFSGVFANNTPTITTSGLSAGATTLSTAQMPSHTHSTDLGGPGSGQDVVRIEGQGRGAGSTSGAAGSGGSHSHSLSGSATSSAITLAVQYVDLIIATKN